ncbi:MAG: hypothetical protein LBR39_08060 [Coriobacteriales bacterium]|jgi:hypothetical protein|nr:hypothetical protein [Coriobacteriales bacterium]
MSSTNKTLLSKKKGTQMQKAALLTIGVFALYFLMFIPHINMPATIYESDNMIGALVMKNGALLYDGYPSQHPPLMYFFCYLLTLFGVKGFIGFRVGTYCLLSGFFTFAWLRYKKWYGAIPCLIFPALFISSLSLQSELYSVTTDLLHMMGLVLLLLEFLHYLKTKELSRRSSIALGISVILMLGSAMVSGFVLFTTLLSVLIIEASDAQAKKRTFKEFILHLFTKFKLLFGIIIGALLVFLLYLVLTGTLDDAYQGIWVINREIYPKYNDNKYGSSILEAFILPFLFFFTSLFDSVTSIGDQAFSSLMVASYFIGNICFIFYVFLKNKLHGLMIFVFIVMSMARYNIAGGWHMIPYYAVSCFTLLYPAVKAFQSRNKYREALPAVSIFPLIASLLICNSYIVQMPANLNRDINDTYTTAGSTGAIINAITTPEDRILVCDVRVDLYIGTGHLPAAPYGGISAWMTEKYGQKGLEDFAHNQPKVVIYNSTLAPRGYSQQEYAADYVEYIEANYTPFNDALDSTVYVRNDYYYEAHRLYSSSTSDYQDMGYR